VAQTGHQRDAWPLVILKELVDNAIDAAEEAGIAPVVEVTVDDNGISVTDNGPGLPTETVKDILIRRERSSWDEDDDIFIVIARGNVDAAIAEMQFAISQPAQAVQLQLPKPAPRTNAERQCLYRQRHRNEKSNETDELPLRLNGDPEQHEDLGA
jgi:sensor histidine kinase regulating citrate/malate metabolism